MVLVGKGIIRMPFHTNSSLRSGPPIAFSSVILRVADGELELIRENLGNVAILTQSVFICDL